LLSHAADQSYYNATITTSATHNNPPSAASVFSAPELGVTVATALDAALEATLAAEDETGVDEAVADIPIDEVVLATALDIPLDVPSVLVVITLELGAVMEIPTPPPFPLELLPTVLVNAFAKSTSLMTNMLWMLVAVAGVTVATSPDVAVSVSGALTGLPTPPCRLTFAGAVWL
jgi:hypothetical protein